MRVHRCLPPLIALALATGCASGGPPLTVVPAADVAPWEVPPSELGTQRLFRARYEGPQGEGGFRLTLRLAAADRYQAQASAALGKKVWDLEVRGDDGVWIDHRADVYCRLQGRLELADSLLAPLPFRAFPALLLGRLPEEPRSAPRRRGEELVVPGAGGRQWRAEVEGGRVLRWTLWEEGEPVAWWELDGGEAILSDRRHQVQLRWREVVREPLAEEPPPLAVPEGYRLVECHGLDLRPETEPE